jgi:ABC-type multidrug transport system fused ATPase/permease subunit
MINWNNLKFFFSLLNKDKKKDSAFVIIHLIFQSMLEMFGISMVVPILMIILEPEKFQYSFLNILNFEKKELIFFISLVILIFFLFKSIYLYYVNKKTYDFAFSIEFNLKDKFFSHYIKMEYENVLYFKTSKLINDLTINIRLLTQNFIIPVLMIVSESLILLSVLFFLLWYSPAGFLILFSFSLFAIIFFSFFLGKVVKVLGKKKEEAEYSVTKIVQHGIGSIKIARLYDLQEKFINQFNSSSYQSAKLLAHFFALNLQPRYLLELFGFFSILFLIFYFKISGINKFELISTIGLFAAAGFKFIPSINRIVIAIQQIKFSSSIIESIQIIRELINKDSNKQKTDLEKINFGEFKKIEFKNVSFKFRDSDNFILKDLEFIIKKNETVGIMGISGVGKTTFLDIFTGLLNPISGKISINDKEILLSNLNWRNIIAYVPQNTYLLEGTLLENIIFNAELKNIDLESVNKIIKFTKLDSLVNSNTLGIHMMVGEKGTQLSGGQIQRIGFARALYRNPDILILDEPTSSLDNETEDLIISSLNDLKNITKLIVSHKETTLKYCSRILRLKNGHFTEYKK